MRLIIFLFLLTPVSGFSQYSQDSAAFFIKEIYRQSYTELKGYDWLRTLSKDIGPRLSGSENAANAVNWTKQVMDSMGLDRVWLQECMVPKWERGENEHVIMLSDEMGAVTLNALALGNSMGTGPDGVRGEVLAVMTLDELRAMTEDQVAGKIVFFNRPMDMGLISAFSAYGQAADQRAHGPKLAAEKGAIAAVVRSLSSTKDDFPHTGVTINNVEGRNIPSVAISTNDADLLSKALAMGKTSLFIRTMCEMKGTAVSHNVIGEIKGSLFPEEIILVGGHLDSWDVGEGAHDDGSGCVHSMEVLYRLKKMNYKPQRTIRCVLFMNEENGLAGGLKYAEEAIAKNEYHLVAIESDGGGDTPQAFGASPGEGVQLDKHLIFMNDYMTLLEPYHLTLIAGGGGADIGPLKPKAGLLMGLRPDSSRYFDFHHSHLDVLEAVHPRSLAAGSAALTSLVFLIDQYGIGR